MLALQMAALPTVPQHWPPSFGVLFPCLLGCFPIYGLDYIIINVFCSWFGVWLSRTLTRALWCQKPHFFVFGLCCCYSVAMQEPSFMVLHCAQRQLFSTSAHVCDDQFFFPPDTAMRKSLPSALLGDPSSSFLLITPRAQYTLRHWISLYICFPSFHVMSTKLFHMC